MSESQPEVRLGDRNVTDNSLEVFEFYAHCILDEKNYDDRVKMIVKLQMEIQTLHDQFKKPIAHFIKDHGRLIEHELDKSFYTKADDYTERPERMVKDLFNFVYCLAGYGAFYKCPTECTRQEQDF